MAILLGWRDGPGHPARDDFRAVALEVVAGVRAATEGT
jgi:hypothetical protein